MSKIGVGIGEDFPVDDGPNPNGGPGANDDAARREAYRQWRRHRQEWKQRWREEWRARRRDFQDDGGRGGAMAWGHPMHGHHLGRILAVIGAIALIVFAFTHIFYILGAIAVAALAFAAFRNGFDPMFVGPYRRGQDERRAPDDRNDRTPPPAPPAGTQN